MFAPLHGVEEGQLPLGRAEGHMGCDLRVSRSGLCRVVRRGTPSVAPPPHRCTTTCEAAKQCSGCLVRMDQDRNSCGQDPITVLAPPPRV